MVHPLHWLSPHAPFFTHTKGDADLGSSTAFMPLSFALSLPPAFPFHIHLSHMWWEQCLERRDGLLLEESFLILLAKTIHSLWCDYHYFPLFFCVFCSHLDQWPMLFPLLYRHCPITYFSVCQCLVWRPLSNRYGMECLLATFAVTSIFFCPSQMASGSWEFGTLEHGPFFWIWTSPLSILSSSKLYKLYIFYPILQYLASYKTSCSSQLPGKLSKNIQSPHPPETY